MTADRLDSDRIHAMHRRAWVLLAVVILSLLIVIIEGFVSYIMLPGMKSLMTRIPAFALLIVAMFIAIRFNSRLRTRTLDYARQNNWLICPHDFYPLEKSTDSAGVVSCSECGRSWRSKPISGYWHEAVNHPTLPPFVRFYVRKPAPIRTARPNP